MIPAYEPDPKDMGTRIQKEEARMICVICKNGEPQLGKATVTLEREETTLVVKRVPAQVCANCGEEFVDEETTSRLLKTAEEAACAGVQVDVRHYAAAYTKQEAHQDEIRNDLDWERKPVSATATEGWQGERQMGKSKLPLIFLYGSLPHA